MAYKSLLTVATRGDRCDLGITGAAAIATAHDAHLDILALGVDRTQVGYAYVGGSGVLLRRSKRITRVKRLGKWISNKPA